MPASAYITEVLADSPRGFWTCQETSGNLADSSGNGLTLTASGSPTYSNAGPMNDLAVGFPVGATASRAQISAATDNLTMEAWVYVATLSGIRAVLVNQSAGVGYQMGVGSSGDIILTIQGFANYGSGANVAVNTWTHIAITRDAGTWKAYFNGQLDQANMTTQAPNAPSGSTTALANTQFNGRIAYGAFYETALSQARLEAHYDAGLAAELLVPHISSTTSVFIPALSLPTITAPFIASGTSVFTPTLEATVIAPPFIPSSTTLFAPTLAATQLFVPFIGPATTLYAPTVAGANTPEGVQIGFDDPLLEPEPTWTRIDTEVRVSRWEIRRGRQGELEKTGTGEATIFVNDTEGLLDPANAGSPWFGKLDGRQVQLSRWNPVTEEWSLRFRGYVEEYGYDLAPSQVKTEVAIRCVGFMDYLAGAEMAPGQAGEVPLPANVADGNIAYLAAEVDDRIIQILTDSGFPTAELAVVFSGNVVVSETIYEPGYSFLAALQDAVDAEFPGVANVYEDRFGRIVFHGRHARFDPDTVAADAGPDAWDFQRWSAGDGAGLVIDPDAAQVRPPVSYDRSLKLVINAALVTPLREPDFELTQAELEAQLTVDATSITAYGVRSWSAHDIRILEHKTNGNTDLEETKLMADYYVANYAEPRTRPRQVTFKPLLPSDPRAAATWALMCGVDISDIVYLYITSPGGGGIDGEYYVEGVTETCRIGPPEFGFGEVTLDVSPTAYYDTDVFSGT